jgi:hypothetical protein
VLLSFEICLAKRTKLTTFASNFNLSPSHSLTMCARTSEPVVSRVNDPMRNFLALSNTDRELLAWIPHPWPTERSHCMSSFPIVQGNLPVFRFLGLALRGAGFPCCSNISLISRPTAIGIGWARLLEAGFIENVFCCALRPMGDLPPTTGSESYLKKPKWRQNIVGKSGRAGLPLRSFNLPPVRIVGPATSTRKQPWKGCRCRSLARREAAALTSHPVPRRICHGGGAYGGYGGRSPLHHHATASGGAGVKDKYFGFALPKVCTVRSLPGEITPPYLSIAFAY